MPGPYEAFDENEHGRSHNRHASDRRSMAHVVTGTQKQNQSYVSKPT